MYGWNPKLSPNAEWMTDGRAEKARDTDHVILDIGLFPKNIKGLDGIAWKITRTHYNPLLSAFFRHTNGVEGFGEYMTYYFPATIPIAATLIDYFHAKPTLHALSFAPQIWPREYARLLANKIEESVFKNLSYSWKIEGLSKRLFPFQIEGILRITYKKGRALLADEMGLGKTVQAIGFWRYNNLGRTLIVCPQTVKRPWKDALLDWLPDIRPQDIELLDSSTKTISPNKIFYIINYDIIGKWLTNFNTTNFDLLILDEAHYVKNSHAQRTKAIMEIGSRFPYILALTGTPIINRAAEVWNILHLLAPQVFGRKAKFLATFTTDKNKILEKSEDLETTENNVIEADDYNFVKIENPEILGKTLKDTVMIRRTKAEVLPQLPEKIRTMVPIPCDSQKMQQYNQAEEQFMKYLTATRTSISDFLLERRIKSRNSETQRQVLAALEKARQAAVVAKLDNSIDWIKVTLETAGKLVIYAHHTFVIQRLMKEFSDYAVCIIGDQSEIERDTAVKRFQNDPQIKIIVVSILAGGVGLTLTAANTLVILETSWSPAQNEQAEDRIHRIGQEADCVNIYHLVGEDTIDVPIYKLIYAKQTMINQVHEAAKQNEGQTLAEIMNELKRELNPLGFTIGFDGGLAAQLLPLKPPKWFTLNEAAAFAQERGSKIIRSNLLDDIKSGKIPENERKWIPQTGARGGYWVIAERALLNRMNERLRGRGRPKKV